MIKMEDIVTLESGTSQSRITESNGTGSRLYWFYGHAEMENDLTDLDVSTEDGKWIRTKDDACVVQAGDIVFGLLSGKATVVRPNHHGFLLTQNYVKIIPCDSIDPAFLVYLLNESVDIRRQLLTDQQGSVTMRFTVRQLANLVLADLPSMAIQKAIGELYFNQLKLAALRKRQADLETLLVTRKIKEVCQL